MKYKLVEIGQRFRNHNSSDFEILVCERDRERQEVGGGVEEGTDMGGNSYILARSNL